MEIIVIKEVIKMEKLIFRKLLQKIQFGKASPQLYNGAWSYIKIGNKQKKIRIFDCVIKKGLKKKISTNFFQIKNKIYLKTLDYPILVKKYKIA